MNIVTFQIKTTILPIVLLIFVFGFVACGGAAPAADAPAAAEAPAAAKAPAAAAPSSGMYNEAPMLAEKVASGELPPVDERLPFEPLVVDEWEYVGEYGTEMEINPIAHEVVLSDVNQDRASDMVGITGIDGWDNEHLDLQWLRILDGEPLLRWSSDCSLEGNLASSFEINEEETEFTFYLREGIKWSDGELFTAGDIMFWYEDVLINPEITSRIPSWLMAGDNPVEVEQLDDFTVVFRFDVSDVDSSRWPMPTEYFLPMMAITDWPTSWPKHYVEQYGPNEVGTTWRNPDLPTLDAWRIINPFPGLELERNPYYWKVDGNNQLPYLDFVIDQTGQQGSTRNVLALRSVCLLRDIETWIPYPSPPPYPPGLIALVTS